MSDWKPPIQPASGACSPTTRGGHVELRRPIGDFAPFVFGGGGAVRVDQQGAQSGEEFSRFTRFAGMFGAGLSYQLPNAPFEVLAEGKALTYKWVAEPFSRNQWDISYSIGFACRFGF